MKKKIKALVAVLTAVALLTMVPNFGTMRVKAAEPTTYSVVYMGGSVNEWRYLANPTFDPELMHLGVGYLRTILKDGDNVIVYAGDNLIDQHLDLGTAKLGSLTVANGASVVVKTGGVQNCYINANTNTAINGNITTASVFGNTNVNFNNNVFDLIYYMADPDNSNIYCAGTVTRFYAVSAADQSYRALYYDVQKGKASVVNGSFNVPDWAYSTSADNYNKGAGNSGSTGNTGNTGNKGNKGNNGEYDDVPKTGQSNTVYWLLAASAACFTGSVILRKKENN